METVNIAACDMVSKSNLLQYVIIGVGCVALGAIIDLFCTEDDIGKIHAKFRRWAERLRETPLQEWQIAIAKRGTGFMSNLAKQFTDKTAFLVDLLCIRAAKRVIPGNTSVIFGKTIRKIIAFLVLFMFTVATFLAIPIIYFTSHLWIVGSITFPLVIFFVVIVYIVILAAFPENISKPFVLPDEVYRLIVATPFFSAALSLLAMLIAGYAITHSLLNTHWFVAASGNIAPKYPLLLPVINFPFDFATIFVTISLLRYVAKKRKYIGLAALADIAISAALTILLYCFLRIIENGWDIGNAHTHFMAVIGWFSEIGKIFLAWITNKPSGVDISNMRDIHLLPILLTTFVPVTIYMSIFLFLSFCKGVMLTTARLFHAVSTKKESVFKQFGSVIGILAALTKAIYDYLGTL